MHYHLALGRRAGLSDRQVHDLDGFEASEAYSVLEKDVLRFTEQWTNRGRVDGDVLVRLSVALPAGHLVLLAATVGQANFTSRFNVVFGVEKPRRTPAGGPRTGRPSGQFDAGWLR
jgi:hypothetical protein